MLVNVSPDVVVRNEGDDVDLFCEATATPPATLTWFKDGRQLASSGHVTVAGNHVVLRGVERSDAGVYSCTFKNVVGIVSHLIKLVIQGVFTLHVQLSDLTCFCRTSDSADHARLSDALVLLQQYDGDLTRHLIVFSKITKTLACY